MKMQTLNRSGCGTLGAALAALLMGSAAFAAGEPAKLVLSGFTDAAAGDALMAGHYAAVIDRLAPHAAAFDADQVAASTNLCVAYVAAGRLQEAHPACDEAVATARRDMPGATLADHLAHDNAVAIAYANRAVLDKLAGE